MALVIGNIYEGKVVNITNFGAFVDINGETGLVHISEVSNKYIKDIRDYLKDKLDVRVKVLSIDDSGKISLSLKQAEGNSLNVGNNNYKKIMIEYMLLQKSNASNFEDILSKYLKDSEERMQDFRKNQDSKQKRI